MQLFLSMMNPSASDILRKPSPWRRVDLGWGKGRQTQQVGNVAQKKNENINIFYASGLDYGQLRYFYMF